MASHNTPQERPTVLRPVPGGQFPSAPQQPPRPRGDAPALSAGISEATWNTGSIDRTGLNPLETAASTLLSVLARLHQTATHSDPDSLRQRLSEEVKAFERKASAARVKPEDVFVARYALCSALDDAVLNRDWGIRSNWSQQPLLYIFHKEKKGRGKVFRTIDKLLQDSQRYRHLLELIYICLAFGYQGSNLAEDQLANDSQLYREKIYREIRPGSTTALSPNWKGISERSNPLVRYVPLWVVGALAALLLVGIYTALTIRINQLSDPVFADLHRIGVQNSSRIPVQPDTPSAPAPDQIQLKQLLAEDISNQMITLNEQDFSTVIVSTIPQGGLFKSGSAQIRAEHGALIQRIGDALAQLPGKILVVGHTDDIPPRPGFPSNQALSLSRAKSVEKMLRERTASPERYYPAEGHGKEEPLFPNDSAANRARNRRIEITLHHYAAPQ